MTIFSFGQKGSASILLIAFSLIGFFIFAFVTEVGEIFLVNAEVENAAEAGAHAASYALGKEINRLLKSGESDPNIILEKARTKAEEEARAVVQDNGAELVPPIAYLSDFEVKVTVRKTFTPVFDTLINKSFEFKKSAQSEAKISKIP